MISGDLRFEGFDAASWGNLLSLFSPGMANRGRRDMDATDFPSVNTDDGAEAKSSGTLVVVVDASGSPLAALHTERGRISGFADRHAASTPNTPPSNGSSGRSSRKPSLRPPAADSSADARPDDRAGQFSPGDLADLCRRYRAGRCIVLREGAAEELMERVSLRLVRGEDYAAQWLTMWRVYRELLQGGHIQIWPSTLTALPIPTSATLERSLDLILPDGRAAVVALFDRGRLWTAAALRRRHGHFDFVAGPDLIAHWTGPLGGDWRRDYRIVSDAVARAVAPVHAGVYSDVSTVRALLREPDPGRWARAVAVRDLIVHPTPPYAAVALGADAVRGVGQATARVLGGVNLLAALNPVTHYVRGRISEIASVTETLGFNPLSALASVVGKDSDGEFFDKDADRP